MADPLQLAALDTAVLVYLLDRHPAPVHQDDLARTFRDDDWSTSVSSLEADGVVYREGALLLASTATVRTSRLLG